MLLSSLPTELLTRCLEPLCDDYNTLYHCSLVNHSFSVMTAEFLYKRIVIPLTSKLSHVEKEEVQQILPWLFSAMLSQNTAHVKELVILGAFDGQPDSNDVKHIIRKAVLLWPNIEILRLDSLFAMSNANSNIIFGAVDHVAGLPCLREFEFQLRNTGHQTSDESYEEWLQKAQGHILQCMNHLTGLTLEDPNRLVLQLMLSWLTRSPPLTKLHLVGNCGSVTPGVLQSFLPHLSALRSLAIGLSYSLANKDILSALSELPELQELQIQYYWQAQTRSLKRGPRLRKLKRFKVLHPPTEASDDAFALGKWIRLIISGASLEELHLKTSIQDYNGRHERFGPVANHNGLIAHLVARHARTLRVLNMEECYVSWKTFCTISRCTRLEQLKVGIKGHQLSSVSTSLSGFCALNQICIRTRNIKLSNLKWETSHAIDFFTHAPPSVQYLQVNFESWRAVWGLSETGVIVRRITEENPHPPLPFWERLKLYLDDSDDD